MTDAAVREAVIDVLHRYATGIDARDWPLFRTCFTDDCDVDYGDIGHWHGLDALTEWMIATHAQVGPTLHRITNAMVAHDGQGLTARSDVHAVVVTPDRASAVHAFGWYEDRFVDEAGEWRIAMRRFTTVATELHRLLG